MDMDAGNWVSADFHKAVLCAAIYDRVCALSEVRSNHNKHSAHSHAPLVIPCTLCAHFRHLI